MADISLRRFFFDDGSSRKRWAISTKGKVQLVHFGRLTGTLKESKKTFGSPAEAQHSAETLIAEKRRSGYVEIKPARLEILRDKKRRAATDLQIKTLEKQLGLPLPGEYAKFLKTCNGGRPNPHCVKVPGAAGIDNVGVGSFFYLNPSKPEADEITYQIEHTKDLLPKGHLPIAGDSDLFTLSLHAKTLGAVYWWFHESEEVDNDGKFLESAGFLLAGSFDEFLTRIALLFEADEPARAELNKAPLAKQVGQRSKASLRSLLKLIRHEHTPATVKEIKRLVKELGDLSGIEDGQWPFVNFSSSDVLRCLLDAGLNPEITDTEGQSLLFQSACSPECVEMLADRGVDLDRRSGANGFTALMRAIFLQRTAPAIRLIELGANPCFRLDRFTGDRLKSNSELARFLAKAQKNWQNRPKSKVPAQKQQGIANHAANVNKSNTSNATIQKLLGLMKHDRIMENEVIPGAEEMIAQLRDLRSIRDGEWPAIDKFENPQLLESLLASGLSPEIVDKKGNTLLHQCVSNPDCIDLIVKRRIRIDRLNTSGETALMYATYKGDEECVQRLLDAGANPTLEFKGLAGTFFKMQMNKRMFQFIETAREKWHRKHQRQSEKGKGRGKPESGRLRHYG
jgi:predicted DNA-binding WGR domain protein